VDWREFQAKAQASADEAGHLILQGQFGNKLIGLGISRENLLQGGAPSELQREFLITRLRTALEGGSVPKISSDNLRGDWQLLQKVISIQKEEEAQMTGLVLSPN
jgi:hypothetical protein